MTVVQYLERLLPILRVIISQLQVNGFSAVRDKKIDMFKNFK
jgi:hypothetical protein